MTSATSCFLTAESQQQLSRSSGRRWTFCLRVHLSVHLSASMRAPVCAALLLWVLSDAAARRFSEEQMAAIRSEKNQNNHRFPVIMQSNKGQGSFPSVWFSPASCRKSDIWSYSSSFLVLDLTCRQRIRSMFYHAYNSYLNNAFPYDELRPLTCDGQDTWGR
ncbi:hypothetical protein XENOCAPTIV_010943 [Xenoophorus captivus]|uniref:Uncharacterized protein n=1 Tax=Xenoophorus captivus TaxID=1517983 RepID=A0ABV0S0C7_9TELE